jgi:hypothetical protein
MALAESQRGVVARRQVFERGFSATEIERV